jgi:hypothetical protein
LAAVNLIVSDGSGNFIEVPELETAGVNFIKPLTLEPDVLIPLPEGSKMIELPRRIAIGYDPDLEKHLQLREYNGEPVYPVAVSLPSGYLQIYRSAFSMVLDSPRLSPASYTVVGRGDHQYLTGAIKMTQRLFPGYDTIFSDGSTASAKEMVDKSVTRLQSSSKHLMRFELNDSGAAPEITRAVQGIRQRTEEGLIYIDAHQIDPGTIKSCCEAGTDWIGVNLNSAQPKYFERFYKRRGHTFEELLTCLRMINQSGCGIILNYGVFPGLTDHPAEMEALEKLFNTVNIGMFQPYNLPVDPEWYMDKLMMMSLPRKQVGMRAWWEHIGKDYPGIEAGYLERNSS